MTGCLAEPSQPVAPGRYYVNGNTICTADGRAHLFHGVARPSLEFSRSGENLSPRDFHTIASWNANVVRIGLNQDFWLSESPLFDPNYASLVDSAVGWVEAEGMDVILDLHWSDAGVLGSCVATPTKSCQQEMPDVNSVQFWTEVAARYREDGRVIFELYNEPHDVSWSVWRAGGVVREGFQAAGMQELYDAVRAAGAQNLVLIGGLDWAYDLSGIPAHRIDGYNIAYVTHPYNTPNRRAADWDRAWGFLTRTDPVIVTEFGELNDSTCATAYSAALIQYADAHNSGWTAWGWYPGGCTFPALIEDWSATPSATGALVKAALLAYPHPSSPAPATPLEVDYTFERGTEGWALVDYHDPDFTNLGSDVPDGEVPPTLSFSKETGAPSPGALRLTVTFSAGDQYVVARAAFGSSGLDLSGKILNANVRLISGTLPGAHVSLHACSGPSWVCPDGQGLEVGSMPYGVWMPLTYDLSSVPDARFDPKKILAVDLQVLASTALLTGAESSDVEFGGKGQLVFEIDSVNAR